MKPIISLEGRGPVLDASLGALLVPADGILAVQPFTVEVWAQPRCPMEWLVALRLPEFEKSWAFTIGGDGDLAAYFAAKGGQWFWNQHKVVDGRWHHLAMTYDGQTPAFFIDGVSTKVQESGGNQGRKLRQQEGLQIGSTTLSRIYFCTEALLQEVRLSRGLRAISPDPGRLEVDSQTVALWRMDRADAHGIVPNLAGPAAAGRLVPLPDGPAQSMDEVDRLSFKAGLAPLEGPAERVTLTAGAWEDQPAAAVCRLDGAWEMAQDGAEQARLAGDWGGAIAAQIPGSVHTALQAAGLIPDPKHGRNDAIAREKSTHTWWFRRQFPRPAGEGHRLVFDGVAVHCTVWLNGRRLGEHEGMFGGPSLDVAGLLREENELIVKLDPAPYAPSAEGIGENPGWKKTVVFNNVYGWHYSNIPALGIWRSVRIEAAPTVRMADPFLATMDAAKGHLRLRVDLQGPATGFRGRLVGVIAPRNFDGPTQHFEKNIQCPSASSRQILDIHLLEPQLWWPNGYGPQNLYRLQLRFEPDRGTAAQFATTFGIRTIQMSPLPAGPKPTRYNWTFVVNGRPMFIKGTGWCTMDSSMDFSRERYARFLKIAQEENCQMVRAWGSGMPETEEFYDLCDELGLLVMQEWPTAWNSHEVQPYDVLDETVRLNTVRIRNHPSLVMYGGGNESNDPFGPAIDMMGRHAIELDGTRAFHRGEPWGGSNHNYACWWARQHLDHNLQMTADFFGEFGIASLPVYESVQRYLPDSEKHTWPAPDEGSLAYHTPIFNRAHEMARLTQYASYFTAGATMARFIQASQMAQAVALRTTLERARTRWPQCTGALLYKLNDNYPAASWSTADWYGACKLSHWFVQQAFAPVHACLLLDHLACQGQPLAAPVFLLDDVLRLHGEKWQVGVQAYDASLRAIAAETFSGQGSEKTVCQLGMFQLTAQQTEATPLLIVAELRVEGQLVDRTFYFLNCEARQDCLFELPRTSLSLATNAGEAIVTNTGKLPAVGVLVQRLGHLETFSASHNCLWLNPGESVAIAVNCIDGLSVDAWNVDR